MEVKTIKISGENYRWLLRLAADMQRERGEIVSFDKALNELKKKKMESKNKKLSELAGRWKMSDEEAKKFMKEAKEGWKKWKIPSV